jgi:hypothetical protein
MDHQEGVQLQHLSKNRTNPKGDSYSACVLQELAWSSFALLKNVNCCSVLLLQPSSQSALLARGAVAASCVTQGDNKASLQRISLVGP